MFEKRTGKSLADMCDVFPGTCGLLPATLATGIQERRHCFGRSIPQGPTRQGIGRLRGREGGRQHFPRKSWQRPANRVSSCLPISMPLSLRRICSAILPEYIADLRRTPYRRARALQQRVGAFGCMSARGSWPCASGPGPCTMPWPKINFPEDFSRPLFSDITL